MALEVGFTLSRFLGLKTKNLKRPNFSFVKVFFTYCVTNLIKMIFIVLRFVAFTWPNLCSLDLSLLSIVLVGRNFCVRHL